MPLDWTPFVDFVHGHQRFLLTTHVRPDADGLGALQALGDAIEALGKQTTRVIPSRMPHRYDFLDPHNRLMVFTSPSDVHQNCDAVIVVDTGTWNQLDKVGPFIRTFSGTKVVVDHHPTQDDLGATRFVDVTAEATGRLVYEAIRALDLSLTPAMATGLFTAIAWDTGWFRHSSTTPWTYALCGELQAAGANPTLIYEALFERSTLERLRLTGRMLERLNTRADGRIVFSEVRLSDYPETGANPMDTEDFVNFPRSVEGVEVAILFIEQREGGVKASFRSRHINVSKIAEHFGGGGHKLAAGATLPGPFQTARDRVLHAVEDAVKSL